jgi:TPR repeat protein
MRIVPMGILLAASLLGCDGARARNAPPKERALDVASLIAGCSELAECDERCAKSEAAACVSAGRLREYGHGVAVDAARAYRDYDRACALGHSGGCYNAALLLEAGRGVARDAGRAHDLFAKVCAMGSKTACARADGTR